LADTSSPSPRLFTGTPISARPSAVTRPAATATCAATATKSAFDVPPAAAAALCHAPASINATAVSGRAWEVVGAGDTVPRSARSAVAAALTAPGSPAAACPIAVSSPGRRLRYGAAVSPSAAASTFTRPTPSVSACDTTSVTA
jgi:hypothetical protein